MAGKAISEYEVENLFIERLEELGYDYIPMRTFSDTP